jgi:hypothetical protein
MFTIQPGRRASVGPGGITPKAACAALGERRRRDFCVSGTAARICVVTVYRLSRPHRPNRPLLMPILTSVYPPLVSAAGPSWPIARARAPFGVVACGGCAWVCLTGRPLDSVWSAMRSGARLDRVVRAGRACGVTVGGARGSAAYGNAACDSAAHGTTVGLVAPRAIEMDQQHSGSTESNAGGRTR